MAQVIEMPKLSDTMAVGTVVKWHKTKGDTVSNGDILAEIETDKATMELENFDEGVLLDIIVEEGHEAPIGSPLAIVGDQNEDISSLIPSENIKDETTPVEKNKEIKIESSEEKLLSPEVSSSESSLQDIIAEPNILNKNDNERVLASPLAKKIALENNITLSTIKGSGPRGRIIKKDLVKPVESTDETILSAAQPIASYSESSVGILSEKMIPVSNMRKVIASRLLESKTTIHTFLFTERN